MLKNKQTNTPTNKLPHVNTLDFHKMVRFEIILLENLQYYNRHKWKYRACTEVKTTLQNKIPYNAKDTAPPLISDGVLLNSKITILIHQIHYQFIRYSETTLAMNCNCLKKCIRVGIHLRGRCYKFCFRFQRNSRDKADLVQVSL